MSVGTLVRVFNRTMSVNYIADELVRIFQTVSIHLGLGVGYIQNHWSPILAGLRTWLNEGSLRATYLEVFTPAGHLVTRFDIQIGYGSVLEDENAFYNDIESAKFAIRKIGAVPRGCRYRIVADRAHWASSVEGWSSTTLRSTAGLQRLNTGPLIGSPHIQTSLGIWIR